MKALRLLALVFVAILASYTAAAYHYDYYPSYGTYDNEYTRSRSSESVSSRESEWHRSSYGGCGWSYCHSRDTYDYGRNREFSFSRTTDYENERHSSSAGYPQYGYGRGYSTYSYPYSDVGTSYGRDYRPYHDDYEMSFTSPYYNPYQYSRVGAYSGYRPYGY